jgi:hypothetical protein
LQSRRLAAREAFDLFNREDREEARSAASRRLVERRAYFLTADFTDSADKGRGGRKVLSALSV